MLLPALSTLQRHTLFLLLFSFFSRCYKVLARASKEKKNALFLYEGYLSQYAVCFRKPRTDVDLSFCGCCSSPDGFCCCCFPFNSTGTSIVFYVHHSRAGEAKKQEHIVYCHCAVLSSHVFSSPSSLFLPFFVCFSSTNVIKEALTWGLYLRSRVLQVGCVLKN